MRFFVTLQSSLSSTTGTDHRFDMDAEPEPIPTADDNMSVMGGGDSSFQDMDDVEGTIKKKSGHPKKLL